MGFSERTEKQRIKWQINKKKAEVIVKAQKLLAFLGFRLHNPYRLT